MFNEIKGRNMVKQADFVEFPRLEQVTKPNLTTKEFCFYTNLSQQTAWLWSCKGKGPIRPLHIGRKLNWPTHLVKKLCEVS